MAFFNFRNTAGYVTDGANTTYVLDNDTYPISRNGETFGWVDGGATSSIQTRDRLSSNPAPLAGEHFTAGNITGAEIVFFSDSGAGTFDVTLACGQIEYSRDIYTRLLEVDSAGAIVSVLATVSAGTTVAGGRYMDATGVIHTSAANWASNNSTLQVVVGAGNHLGVGIGDPTGTYQGETTIQTFGYTAVASLTPTLDSVDTNDILEIYEGVDLNDVAFTLSNDSALTSITSIDVNGTAATDIQYTNGSGSGTFDVSSSVSVGDDVTITINYTDA